MALKIKAPEDEQDFLRHTVKTLSSKNYKNPIVCSILFAIIPLGLAQGFSIL